LDIYEHLREYHLDEDYIEMEEIPVTVVNEDIVMAPTLENNDLADNYTAFLGVCNSIKI
jgi:hypothetical protein